MKILLMSVGTRGDMEPFLSIGEMLHEKGHRPICAFPEQFRNLAEDAGLEFASLGSKFIELLESDDGRAVMGGGGSGLKKFVATVRLASKQTDANKELVFRQRDVVEREMPDRIVYNGKAIYPIIWGLKNPGKTIFLSPLPYMHYVEGHTHVAFNSNFGTFLNKLTFSLAHFGMVATVNMARKWLKTKEKIAQKDVLDVLKNKRSIYTISPALFPQPKNWSREIKVAGYHERKGKSQWESSKELNAFLEKHDKILFITFGSMINPEPEKKTRLILDILVRNRIPAIINTAAGGLMKPDGFKSDLIRFVSNIPYHLIFPKVHGVIHHGGSGTTHLALKNGCATLIIPHIIDQFVWDKLVSDLGAGPKGVKIGKISAKNLEPKIIDLFNNPSYKARAKELAGKMQKEDYGEMLLEMILGTEEGLRD